MNPAPPVTRVRIGGSGSDAPEARRAVARRASQRRYYFLRKTTFSQRCVPVRAILSLRSAVTTSRPGPQRIRSRVLSRARMRSLPLPPSMMSRPEPPVIVSPAPAALEPVVAGGARHEVPAASGPDHVEPGAARHAVGAAAAE